VTEINYLQAFYAALLELGLVETNPAAGLKSWRPHSPRRPITLLGVRALLLEAARPQGPSPERAAIALRNRGGLELLFATGMRASEVCAAQVVDLDLEDGSILVRRAKRGPGRRLPIPGPTIAALRAYLAEGRGILRRERADPGALFLTKHGTPLTCESLLALVKAIAKRAGVRVAFPHLFRRTLATELARVGVSLPVIQKVLGHAHLSTTGDYVEVSLDVMRAALDDLARQIPESQSGPSVPPNLQRSLFPPQRVAPAA
jgi:site-specific recombinase XerD